MINELGSTSVDGKTLAFIRIGARKLAALERLLDEMDAYRDESAAWVCCHRALGIRAFWSSLDGGGTTLEQTVLEYGGHRRRIFTAIGRRYEIIHEAGAVLVRPDVYIAWGKVNQFGRWNTRLGNCGRRFSTYSDRQ